MSLIFGKKWHPLTMKRNLVLSFLVLLISSASFASMRINLILSVDWEGYSLEEENLRAFQQFRQEYPEVKIIHFLNAAYFLNPGFPFFKSLRNRSIAQKIQSVIRPGDELGVHIHAQETLLKASGVEFREHETFWGHEKSVSINGVRGHDVPLTLFSEEEIIKLLKTSVQILNENGFHNLYSFRAGGWAASPEVLNALVATGFRIDSSAVAPEIVKSIMLKSNIGSTDSEPPIYKNVVHKLWRKINPKNDKAFTIETSHGPIVELPNNFGLADYVTGEEVFSQFLKTMNLWHQWHEEYFNLHFGFHQETASLYLGRVKTLINKLREHFDGRSQKFLLKSSTFEDLILYPQLDHKTLTCRQLFI